MIKTSKIADGLKELNTIARGPITPEAAGKIKRAISGSSSLLVSRAVDIAAEVGLQELVPDMISVFGKFMEDGAKADKGCKAKISVVKALNAFDSPESEIVLAGAYYVQMEAGFGLPEDTAVELRSLCALALARLNHPSAHYILADLLVDPERGVRVAAAKAITYLGEPEGEMALRLKVLTGDKEDEVLGECFQGLMTMSPKRSLEFVARYLLGRNPQIAEYAAIALGRSHLPEAFAMLKRAWDGNPSPAARRALLLPIALMRSDEAFEHLLGVVRAGDRQTATDALSALNLYLDDRYLVRLREAVAARNEPDIKAKFEQEFGSA